MAYLLGVGFYNEHDRGISKPCFVTAVLPRCVYKTRNYRTAFLLFNEPMDRAIDHICSKDSYVNVCFRCGAYVFVLTIATLL